MEGRDGIPHLDCEISEDNLKEGIEKIAHILRPAWNVEEIDVECRSTGYCNKNYVLLKRGTQDGLFLRLLNLKIPDMITNTFNAMIYLKRQNLGAKMLLTFKNGLVMEFIPGRILTWESVKDIREKEIWLSTAREMARYHSSTNYDDIKELGIKSMKDMKKQYEDHFDVDKGCESVFADYGFPSANEIKRWKNELIDMIEAAGADIQFCHVDSNPTNCIITNEGVVFVDYDFCALDYCCVDVAGLFCFTADIHQPGFEKELTTEAEEEPFLREYLRTRAELEPSRGTVTEELIKFWQFLIRKSKLIFYLDFITTMAMMKETTHRPIDEKIAVAYLDLYKNNDKYFHEQFHFQ